VNFYKRLETVVQRSLKVPKYHFPMATHCSKIMEFMMLVGKLKVCYAMLMYWIWKGDIKWIYRYSVTYAPLCGSTFAPLIDSHSVIVTSISAQLSNHGC